MDVVQANVLQSHERDVDVGVYDKVRRGIVELQLLRLHLLRARAVTRGARAFTIGVVARLRRIPFLRVHVVD